MNGLVSIISLIIIAFVIDDLIETVGRLSTLLISLLIFIVYFVVRWIL